MEIAESKRLFYVGCTRAENHLVISGGKPPREPDHMFEKSNWMGWLHTAMDISPDGDLSGECPKDLFEYMRISREDVPFSLSPAEYWRKVLDRAETAIPVKTPRLEKLIAPVSPLPISGKPEHLSPTQIMDYHTCPALYLFRHVYGFTGTHPGEHDGGFGERYGLFAHRVLEKWDFGAGLQVTGRGGSRTDSTPIEEQTAENGWQTTDSGIHELLSLVDTTAGSDIPRKWRDKLKEELRCFSNSPLYRHIRRADELHREEPFAFLQDDVLVRGTMDLFYKTGDDLYIVDYKTESIGADKVDAISERFRLQIGMYGVAVSRTEYQVPAKLVIYYLTPCASYEIPCSQKFLDDISSALTHIIDAMTGSDFSPKKSDRCETCPYAELCNR